MPVWLVGSPASAGPLVTASAVPHWPFKLTDDALQVARACLAAAGFRLCRAAGFRRRRAPLAVQVHR